MKGSIVRRQVGMICLAIFMVSLSSGCREDDEEKNLPEADRCPLERLARFCDKMREAIKMQRERDVLGQVELLRDKDPWVRHYVYQQLLLPYKDMHGRYIKFDAWGDPEEIEKQVAAFKEGVMEKDGKYGAPAPPIQKNRSSSLRSMTRRMRT